jgi:hypothetical protein
MPLAIHTSAESSRWTGIKIRTGKSKKFENKQVTIGKTGAGINLKN